MDATGPRISLRSEQGLTLVELLVAMVTSLVVGGALLGILGFSLRQETRITDRVQVDQIGRTAMTKVVEQLRSSCTGLDSTAIQGPSTTPTSPLATTGPTDLWYLTAYGSTGAASAAVTGVTEHDIHWTPNSVGATIGTLYDYSWPSTGGEPPYSAWTFNATLSTTTAAKKVLATNVIPLETSTSKIFTYWKYETNPASTATYGTLVEFPSTGQPTATTAKLVAKVGIGFTQAPEHGDIREGHTTSFNSSVLLRFRPTESGLEGTTCT
jgi:Tfp pilus assembly protein PilV